MATYQNFQVEPVQWFQHGHGFNIANQHHRPLFSIVYPTKAEAEAARNVITAALATAIEVSNYA